MFDDKMLKEIVAASLPQGENTLDEAYVAQPKRYPLVTDLVSQQTKDTHTKIYEEHVAKLSHNSMKVDTTNRLNVDSSTSDYRHVKSAEVFQMNSVYLHEMYFANCFDPSSEIFMDSLAFMRLQRDFGTFEQWQLDFLAAAQANRNGWAICGYSLFLRRYVNTFIDENGDGGMIGLIPMIVVDTHKHAYFRDYLDDKKSYIVAMMQELNWDVIEGRFNKAETINEALK